jgi:polyisoprenoid-binding protein YceI
MLNLRTRKSALRRIALLVPAVIVAAAWTHAVGRMPFAPESKLWIEGTSTVRSFKCYATALEGSVGYAGELGAGLEQDARSVDAVDLGVPAMQLDCKNDKMNSHMRKALKTDANPTIRYRLTSHEVATGADGALTVTLKGMLLLAGQEKELSMVANAAQDPDGRYRIMGSAELRMTEFGIKPPSLMLGTMKVHDKVVVKYEILLNPQMTVMTAAR